MKNLKELRIHYILEDTSNVIEFLNKALACRRSQLDSLLRMHLFICDCSCNENVQHDMEHDLEYDSTFWRTYFQTAFPNLQEFSISKRML